jgi:hypothetical protein
MRGRLDDPVSDIDLALDEALGMTTRREIARVQDEAGKARRFPGIHLFRAGASLGNAIRRLSFPSGQSSTVTVAGDRVAVWTLVYVKAGVPADSDFPTTPPDGTMALNTSANRVYVRSGGTWRYAALT